MTRRVLLRSAGIAASIAAAIVGVVVYANDPGVLTYHVNLLLLTPLLSIVLHAAGRALPYWLQWPLFLLAVEREERVRERDGDREPSFRGWVDGPWGPP